jgi:hypothetical protein
MTIGLFRNVVSARAIAVEPIRRAICADPIDADKRPFAQKSDRWRVAARCAARSTWTTAAHETAVQPDDADLP